MSRPIHALRPDPKAVARGAALPLKSLLLSQLGCSAKIARNRRCQPTPAPLPCRLAQSRPAAMLRQPAIEIIEASGFVLLGGRPRTRILSAEGGGCRSAPLNSLGFSPWGRSAKTPSTRIHQLMEPAPSGTASASTPRLVAQRPPAPQLGPIL